MLDRLSARGIPFPDDQLESAFYRSARHCDPVAWQALIDRGFICPDGFASFLEGILSCGSFGDDHWKRATPLSKLLTIIENHKGPVFPGALKGVFDYHDAPALAEALLARGAEISSEAVGLAAYADDLALARLLIRTLAIRFGHKGVEWMRMFGSVQR